MQMIHETPYSHVHHVNVMRLDLRPRLHQGNILPGNILSATCVLLPSTCCLYIGNKIVASLLPVCCWIQRDTSRPWRKWIVIMLPRARYRQHVARTSNMLTWCKRGLTSEFHSMLITPAAHSSLLPCCCIIKHDYQWRNSNCSVRTLQNWPSVEF